MPKGEKKISKELLTPSPKANCKAFLVFLLMHLSTCCTLSMLEVMSRRIDVQVGESWLRCQMSMELANNVINTGGIGHAVRIGIAWVLWCFVVYLQHVGKLLSTWNDPLKLRRWGQTPLLQELQRTPSHFSFCRKYLGIENSLSTERKLLLIPAQSSGAKTPEFKTSLD